MKGRFSAVCQTRLVVAYSESRISGCWKLIRAATEARNRLAESTAEGKMNKPLSCLQMTEQMAGSPGPILQYSLLINSVLAATASPKLNVITAHYKGKKIEI